jgi:hypothetical protein
MLDQVTADTFKPCVGDVFQLHLSESERVPVRLIAADELPGSHASGRTPFSLLFRTPGGLWTPQGTYRVEHGRIGALDVFLVPVTPDADGPRLEAVFA